jgi:hypothetical protein
MYWDKSYESNKTCDRFELIISIHRFFGIAYYGYDSKIQSFKRILFVLYQTILISGLIWIKFILISKMIQTDKTDFYKNLGGKAFVMMLIIHLLVSILSNFIFSFKGKQLKEIIERLRDLASNLDTNNILNRELKTNRYYIYLSFGFQTIISAYSSQYFGDIFFCAFF